MTQLSISAGLSPGACSKALTTSFPSAERAIADCIGKPLHKIWPGRYSLSGKRLRHTERQHIKSGSMAASQKVGAA